MDDSAPSRRRRLSSPLLPAALLGLAAVPLALWWSGEVADTQQRNLQTLYVIVPTAVLLLLWFTLLSPLPRRVRLGTAAAAAALLAVLRIEGSSGDLVPILRLRGVRAPVEEKRLASVDASRARDFPRFLGPTGDAKIPGPAPDPDWAARPPRVIWRRPVGPAWSGFAVAGGLAVTQEQRDGEECVVAYDLVDGRERWRHADAARYDTTVGGIGPRATPALHEGRVYSLGATGILNALDARTGSRLWTARIEAPVPDWGFAGSPLVDGRRVVVLAGGLHAYDLESGARLWSRPGGTAGYASPLRLVLAGAPQFVRIDGRSVHGHALEDGRELWSHPWRGEQPKAAQPVALGDDRLLISAGYGIGSDVFRIVREGASWTTRPIWTSTSLKAKFSNAVERDGTVYGLDDGRLVCVESEDGRRRWRGERYGHGQLLLAGGLLLIGTERGEVALVEADPAAFRERARLGVFDHKQWNSPALAGPYLLLRTDREAVCLELPLKD